MSSHAVKPMRRVASRGRHHCPITRCPARRCSSVHCGAPCRRGCTATAARPDGIDSYLERLLVTDEDGSQPRNDMTFRKSSRTLRTPWPRSRSPGARTYTGGDPVALSLIIKKRKLVCMSFWLCITLLMARSLGMPGRVGLHLRHLKYSWFRSDGCGHLTCGVGHQEGHGDVLAVAVGVHVLQDGRRHCFRVRRQPVTVQEGAL